MPSVAECLKLSVQLDTVSDSARLDVELLLAHALKKDRAWLYTWPEKEIDQSAFELFEKLFERRMCGEPIAYLTGEKAFWSLDLLVNRTTLIPRPETELLVELALEKLPKACSKKSPQDKARVLDLGSGTGAIALAIAKERPDAQVLGVDCIEGAVELAKANAKRNNVGNVEFFQSDWFASISNEKFDLIVSNPPYVNTTDPNLSRGDVRFEPHSALVAKEQGYADLKHIIQSAKNYLKNGAWLLLEHGWQQATGVRELFVKYGYEELASHKDLADIERVTCGKLISD